MWFRLTTLLCLFSSSLLAQDVTLYKNKPKGHENNKLLATNAYEANLVKYKNDTNVLVLPGLVADKSKKRVEVMVESTKLGNGAPCEFTVIAETSDHGYEANLISFAKPSDVHRAIQFIGTEPGQSFDPGSLRAWAKGETFILTLACTNQATIRLEQMVVDKRTDKTLPETGFMFTGSRTVSFGTNPVTQVYVADKYQPKSIVSLFNMPHSVFEVPYAATKDDVFQNIIFNPQCAFGEGEVLTLAIEPVNKDGSTRVRDLVLDIQAGAVITNRPMTIPERLGTLNCQLRDAITTLNKKPSMLSVLEAMSALDRKNHDYFLSVKFGDGVELGLIKALVTIFSTIDNERGVRIDPPPKGQLYYKAFSPDIQLLDRNARIYHPFELAVAEKDGKVTGTLLLVNIVFKSDSSASELEIVERPISDPQCLRKEIDAEIEQTRRKSERSRLGVIMVFAAPTLTYGQLMTFLKPVLTTHTTIHVYLDDPMPPIPKKP